MIGKGFDYFTTTLSISPLKNSAKLREIGLNVPIVTRVFYALKEKGIDFINEHLEEIKQAPTRINKNK